MRLTRTLFASALLVGLCALPGAAAAASDLTARSSGVQAVKAGPNLGYATLDKLRDQERVRVTQCTFGARWCRIAQLDGGPSGWVMGSYLIGSGAKNAVTPFDFGFNPLYPGGLRPRR